MPRKKLKFHVGQWVVDKHGHITKLAHIDAEGVLYEEFGFGTSHVMTKISEVRPLTAKEAETER